MLQRDGAAVLAFSACVLWGVAIVLGRLRFIARGGCDAADALSLVLGGWIVPVFLACILAFVLGLSLGVHPGLQAAAVVMALSGGWSIWASRRAFNGTLHYSTASLAVLIAILCGSVLQRLAFISGLSLPLYFDGAEHYRIIQSLMHDYAPTGALQALDWPTPNYYHLGFHVVLAVIASISQVSLRDLILVSGQIVLATVPISLFLIAHRETGSKLAGLLAVILGALGWYMPSYALNWGKYPAVFSLPVILFTLNTAYLAAKRESPQFTSRVLPAIAVAAGCVAFFIHTRSIIVLGMIFLAWVMAKWWQHRPVSQRLLLLTAVILILIAEFLLIARHTVLNPLFDPYLGSGIWITLLVGLLSIPAFQAYPRLAFSSLLTILFLFLALFIPGPAFAGGTLLDRPLVEIVLFIPLAFVGAAGFAAMTQFVSIQHELARVGGMALISLAIALHAFSNYSSYPSTCCTLVSQDDVVALEWVNQNLPPNDHILIASSQQGLAPYPYPALEAATDAGIWIVPLTGRPISILPYSTDFRQSSTLDLMCQSDVNDIYVGGRPQSFSARALREMPGWYTLILRLPGAEIYHVRACTA